MTSLTSGGSWTNDQHTGEAVDPTGLTFTVNYTDGTSASVSPQAHAPTVWGETAGTQTCTFTYTEAGESVSCAVEANVTDAAPVLTSLSVSGTPAAQYIGQAPDLTGLTFKAVYSDTSEETVDVSDITATPATWSVSGSATMTCSYTEDETTVSANVTVEVHENFEVVGIPVTPQYQNRSVDTTGLSYTYNGVAVDPSNVTVSPSTWDSAGQGKQISFTYDGNTTTKGTDVLRAKANLPVTITDTYPVATASSDSVTFENCIPSMNEYLGPDNHWGMSFVLDTEGGTFAPVSLNEGDLVWWYQTKADYTNDLANGVNAQDMMALCTSVGMIDSGMPTLEYTLYQGYSLGAADTCTDFILLQALSGTYTIASDTEIVYVLGKAKGSVADASTLKPSDVDLLAVWDVTYTV